jgi:hypothetical protein
MGQQEDFRTPAGGADGAANSPPAPLFDERSALKAAPVVPLETVARRRRFARWAGGWRETVRSPQFRRSWPLALLLVATLAAAVAATSIYSRGDDALPSETTAAATAAEPASGAAGGQSAKTLAPPSRGEIENSRAARNARRGSDNESAVAPDAVTSGNREAFAAAALGNLLAGGGDGQTDALEDGRDGNRGKGKRQKRSKRRQGARRGGGGAVLFDVIR